MPHFHKGVDGGVYREVRLVGARRCCLLSLVPFFIGDTVKIHLSIRKVDPSVW